VSRTVRFLVVADPGDSGAWRVAELLIARHGAQARALTAVDLVFGARVTYRTDRLEPAITRDRARVDPAVVLFRAAITAAPWSRRASRVDADYAAAEAYAFLLAWLGALDGRVVNEPSGTGLAGPAWTPLKWLTIAARAGLPVARAHATIDARRSHAARLIEPQVGSRRRILVTDGRTGPGTPEELREPCRALARTSGCGLFALTLTGPVVTAVDPFPDLTAPGEAEAVADLLERRAAT
jgi:hypothetical protein